MFSYSDSERVYIRVMIHAYSAWYAPLNILPNIPFLFQGATFLKQRCHRLWCYSPVTRKCRTLGHMSGVFGTPCTDGKVGLGSVGDTVVSMMM